MRDPPPNCYHSEPPPLPVTFVQQMAQLADAKAELAWLDAEAESRRLEKRLVGEREGLRKLKLFCQMKAREEIACREESLSRYIRYGAFIARHEGDEARFAACGKFPLVSPTSVISTVIKVKRASFLRPLTLCHSM